MPRGSNYQRPYSPAFRREAVELYRRSGRPLAEIACDLGIASESLRVWVRQSSIDEGDEPGASTSELEELRALRREVKVLREREILKKARLHRDLLQPPQTPLNTRLPLTRRIRDDRRGDLTTNVSAEAGKLQPAVPAARPAIGSGVATRKAAGQHLLIDRRCPGGSRGSCRLRPRLRSWRPAITPRLGR